MILKRRIFYFALPPIKHKKKKKNVSQIGQCRSQRSVVIVKINAFVKHVFLCIPLLYEFFVLFKPSLAQIRRQCIRIQNIILYAFDNDASFFFLFKYIMRIIFQKIKIKIFPKIRYAPAHYNIIITT